jgi:exodeoxyribonuclease V alpha subunit
VLGEICRDTGPYSADFARWLQQLTGCPLPAATDAAGPLADCVALLQHSYRFSGDSGIGALAKAVNGADERSIRRLLKDGTEGIEWVPPGSGQALLERSFDGYRPYLECVRRGDPADRLFTVLRDFRVLCAQRTGPTGVETLNARIEERIRPAGRRDGGNWYPGRPVMVTRNDYSLHLYNGDIGIALPDPEVEGRLRVHFQEAGGGLRSFPTSRLPTCEPVFAMTVHKSQGSEFGVVLLVLPAEESPVLTRELIYTGLTRARRRVCLWGEPKILLQAVRKPVRRASGLGEALARPAVPVPADDANAEAAAPVPGE